MDTLKEKWGAQLLGFALELPAASVNFPLHVLHLLAKHFHFNKLLFFPHPFAGGETGYSRTEGFNSCITLNIDLADMQRYARYFYKFDIFSDHSMPDALKDRNVVFVEDILPLKEYEKTEYYRQFYLPCDIYYQACLFLRANQKKVATVNVYRSRAEGPFTEDDRLLFGYLSDLIAPQYAAVIKSSAGIMARNLFPLFYSKLQMGVVMLNQQLIVLQANQFADEYCTLLLGSLHEEASFQRSAYNLREENRHVQQAINRLCLDFGDGPGDIVLSRVLNGFTFFHTMFSFTNGYGNVETNHLLFITLNKRGTSLAPQHLSLTPRENEILTLVARGYDNEHICSMLHISIFTIRTHLSKIYKKFGVKNKMELFVLLQGNGENHR